MVEGRTDMDERQDAVREVRVDDDQLGLSHGVHWRAPFNAAHYATYQRVRGA